MILIICLTNLFWVMVVGLLMLRSNTSGELEKYKEGVKTYRRMYEEMKGNYNIASNSYQRSKKIIEESIDTIKELKGKLAEKEKAYDDLLASTKKPGKSKTS